MHLLMSQESFALLYSDSNSTGILSSLFLGGINLYFLQLHFFFLSSPLPQFLTEIFRKYVAVTLANNLFPLTSFFTIVDDELK